VFSLELVETIELLFFVPLGLLPLSKPVLLYNCSTLSWLLIWQEHAKNKRKTAILHIVILFVEIDLTRRIMPPKLRGKSAEKLKLMTLKVLIRSLKIKVALIRLALLVDKIL
jgi:hypothetical protein